MAVTLYNTLTRKKEEFVPLEEGIARLYICGPTVYDFAHIGNLRTYLSWDILARVLEHANFQVVETMNVTDVEDKIIANLNGKDLDEFTSQYTKAFEDDLQSLNIDLPDSYRTVQNYKSGFLYATHEVAAMGELIDRIWQHGFAYESEGSIYFDVRKYAEKHKYGVLSNIKIGEQKSRIDSDEYDREEVQDFALWKAHKEGEPSFEITVDGKAFKGRPGWHIECTAMSTKNLGKTFDIHVGGVDHIFPHHENEIAQAVAADPDEDFVKYWLHAEFMLVDGKKMSKSLGNTYTLKDVVEKGSSKPLTESALRFLFLQAHYRTKLNFTDSSLNAAESGLLRLRDQADKALPGDEPKWAAPFKEKFYTRLHDDLDTPGALAAVFELLREMERRQEFVGLADALREFDRILQLDLKAEAVNKPGIPTEVQELLRKRESARKNSDWGESDRLRHQIEEMGWIVQDGSKGSKLVPKR